jgi:PhnB protein
MKRSTAKSTTSKKGKPSRVPLHPHLIVKDAAKAIDFYVQVLGAEEVVRYTDPNLDGMIVYAELTLGGAKFTLAEEHREWHNVSPRSLNGSPVVLMFAVEDADAVAARMQAAGAQIVFPINDQFYGKREGRLMDPFGHLWIVSQPLEELSHAEIQKRVDNFLRTQ